MSINKHFFKQNNLQINTLLILIVVFMLSCKTAKNSVSQNTVIENTPRLIFLNYSAKKIENKSISLQLISKIITDGSLKGKSTMDVETSTLGDLACIQLDENSKIISKTIINNPFIKDIEYMDESKSFQRKRIELNEVEFTLRLTLEPNTKYITISENSTSNKKEEPLIKTPVF